MLTVEEWKQRSAKGLYLNCDESYILGHKCKGRLFRMDAQGECLVEILEQTGEEYSYTNLNDSVTTREISLHAFVGTFNPRTIRLTGWVQVCPLSVLIDNGSTHNFIQESIVNRLGFDVQSLPEFHVFIGVVSLWFVKKFAGGSR